MNRLLIVLILALTSLTVKAQAQTTDRAGAVKLEMKKNTSVVAFLKQKISQNLQNH